MKNRIVISGLAALLCAAGLHVPCAHAQETEAELKQFMEQMARAKKGEAEAQRNLGMYYSEGAGVAKDYVEAVKWFRAAAEQNDADAQILLGACYAFGHGVAKDYAEAYAWINVPAKKDEGSAENLGNLALEMSPQQMITALKRTAELRAQIAARLKSGAHGPQAEADRTHFLEHKAKAEKGDAKAQFEVAICYASGRGVKPDQTESVKWLRKAAEQNIAGAQFALGYRHAEGQGVAKDMVEAVKWLRKAAEQNYIQAQCELGYRFREGRGVTKDYAESVKWFRKAAEQGNSDGQFNMGVCYANGQGVEKDMVQAVKWVRKAAEQNYVVAQYSLGIQYADGEGVEKDLVEAYAWYHLAAKTYETAVHERDNLEKKMSPEQVAAGKKRTEELRAQIDARLKSGGK